MIFAIECGIRSVEAGNAALPEGYMWVSQDSDYFRRTLADGTVMNASPYIFASEAEPRDINTGQQCNVYR